ncbi:hypothetical protein BJ875DRAFT_372258 [Amylocarpus encephaloides]|uniref:Mitochondrial export protein Som1 n=1 Tax=Amylocarpus encephaloides TaxID=45428 RepID=A0A9P7YMQ2_9HELO|nr:hypothetical protein BJ875DRAFT_372258 [Amylocarpus encephaloides]
MPPPVELFPANPSLPERATANLKGRRRKDFDGNLMKCELLELVQYECEVENPNDRRAMARCWPIVRLFRRCRDREGPFTVETTAWEGERSKE